MKTSCMKKGLVTGVCILFLGASFFPVIDAMSNKRITDWASIGSGPDLESNGEIVKRVASGSIVTGSFTVENIGESGSLLDWEVTKRPDFGTNWSINPSSGEDLTPEDDSVTVDVTFIAPIPDVPIYYGGVIKVCEVGNPDDEDLIAVNIGVGGRNRAVNKPLFDGYNRNFFDIAYSSYDYIMPDGEPLLWWNLWPDLPGRYEPMFDVHDIIEYGQTAWGLTSADFNDDGLLDFVASWATVPWTQSTISIFYNDGEGGFAREELYTITEPEATYFKDLNSGDYDLDGDIDLLFTYNEYIPWSYTNGTVNLLFNDGNNNFNECIMIARHTKTEGGEKRINPTITSNDFDDDGDIDFLIGDNSGLVEFYKNDGTGNFISAGIYDFSGGMSWGLSSADFDNDGDIDFIVTQNKNIDTDYIYLMWNDGSESCFNQSNYIKIAELAPRSSFFTGRPILGWGYLQSIDYNNDGMMDFIFGSSDSVFLYMQQGIGVFDYFHIMRLPGVADKEDGGWYMDDLRSGGIAIGDFNGNDLDDMVIGGVQGFVRICYNKFVLVDIVHPDSANLFVGNIEVWQISPIMIYRFLKKGISMAIGDLTVEAKALEPLQKVEFYLGIRKMYTDDSEPFEWEWNSFSFRRCKVKAVGYDMDGEQVGYDDAIVWKFL